MGRGGGSSDDHECSGDQAQICRHDPHCLLVYLVVQARVVSSIGARTPPPNEGLVLITRWPDSVKRQRDGGWAAPAAGRSQDKGEGGGPLPHEYSFFFPGFGPQTSTLDVY